MHLKVVCSQAFELYSPVASRLDIFSIRPCKKLRLGIESQVNDRQTFAHLACCIT